MGKSKEDMIKVYRYRINPYVVNYPTPTGVQSYNFLGSKKGKDEWKMLPVEIVNWLQLSSSCFRDGELVLDKESIEKTDEIYVDENDLEEFEKNSHTRDEAEAILTGNFMKMKSTLNEITSDSEKRFIIDVAKEIKLDSTAKRRFLAEWTEIDVEMLFAEDDEE